MGYANPDQMLRSMTSKLVTEWQAFFMWSNEQEETRDRQKKDERDTSKKARDQARGGSRMRSRVTE